MTNAPESDETKGKEGWTWLVGSPKWHYFRGKISLCCQWMLWGSPPLEADVASRDNCVACWRKRQKELARAAV